MSDVSATVKNLADCDEIASEFKEKPSSAYWSESEEEDEDSNVPLTIEMQLLSAAHKNNLPVVKDILHNQPNIINCSDQDGYTALHRACYGNNLKIVEFLLEREANILATTNNGWQPLHSACHWLCTDIVSLLLQNGADINSQSHGGLTPLHLAASKSRSQQILELLLMNRYINASILSGNGDTAYDVARRSSSFYNLFEITDDHINVL